MDKKIGFPPVFNEDSRLLILGSFPSVKSREVDFYYGNRQNRFWHTLCGYFEEEIPPTVEGKREFLLRRKIALWDMVTSCEIIGSADFSVRNEQLANLNEVLSKAPIEKIFLNGKLAYDLFMREYAHLSDMALKLPSTSPANPRFRADTWRNALNDLFKIY